MIKGESLIPGTISKISGESITTAAWNPDEPFGAVLPFNRIRNLTEYDYYFIYDERYAKQLKEINPNSYYLPFGPDVDVHREQIPLWMRSYKYDISFVGTAYSNRQYLLEQISKKHSSLAIYGHGWSQASKQLKKFVNKKVPMGPALAYVFNESKINLNIYGPSQKFVVPNPRTFEIPASRNFQLATYHKSITRHFKPGKEIVLYRNEDELFELIDWYLDNDEEREKVAQAGYDRVLKEHTMRHRLQRMFKIMNMKL
ncbi:MAG: glycosyltransferase [Candidatus Woesearchaeota archaeon]